MIVRLPIHVQLAGNSNVPATPNPHRDRQEYGRLPYVVANARLNPNNTGDNRPHFSTILKR